MIDRIRAGQQLLFIMLVATSKVSEDAQLQLRQKTPQNSCYNPNRVPAIPDNNKNFLCAKLLLAGKMKIFDLDEVPKMMLGIPINPRELSIRRQRKLYTKYFP